MGIIPTAVTASRMPEQFKAEALSRAYVRAIAAKAGANIRTSEFDFGVDISFCKIKERNGRYTDIDSIPVPCQIKSSKKWEIRGDNIIYDLEVRLSL